MDMIGHDDIFVDDYIAVMFRDIKQQFLRNLSIPVQLLHRAKDTLFLMRTDGDEIIVWSGIIISGDPCGFAFRMGHIHHLSANSPKRVCDTCVALRNGQCPFPTLQYTTTRILRQGFGLFFSES